MSNPVAGDDPRVLEEPSLRGEVWVKWYIRGGVDPIPDMGRLGTKERKKGAIHGLECILKKSDSKNLGGWKWIKKSHKSLVLHLREIDRILAIERGTK